MVTDEGPHDAEQALIDDRAREASESRAGATSSLASLENLEPSRHFVTRDRHPEGTALFRLGPGDALEVWATAHMLEGWGLTRGKVEGWRSTAWPPISVITDPAKYVEIDAAEAERLKPQLASSPTYLDTSPFERTIDGSIPDWDTGRGM